MKNSKADSEQRALDLQVIKKRKTERLFDFIKNKQKVIVTLLLCNSHNFRITVSTKIKISCILDKNILPKGKKYLYATSVIRLLET